MVQILMRFPCSKFDPLCQFDTIGGMLARMLSVAVNGIEAFPVEVEVNSGWGIPLWSKLYLFD
jgi:hypothetical protein